MSQSTPIDAKALHEKYLQERDKRLRPEGEEQYISVEGILAHYSDDPYTSPTERDPITEEVDVLVIGAGFSGMLTAGNLVKNGVTNIRLVEVAGDFGGTWYWNRYPGCRCDVESYIYLPLLEDIGGMPPEKYARSSVIFKHAQQLGRHFGLYDKAHFQTKVTSMQWDEDIDRWIVTTDRNDTIKARFVSVGSGPFNRPKLPGIPGIERFKGHSFHTCRWDYDYTGGTESGNLTGLNDKKVAIIGTGATAVQVIEHLGAASQQLYVFQRTPAAVGPRDNKPTDTTWWEQHTDKLGWQHRRAINFESTIIGTPQDSDMINDGWTAVWTKVFKTVKEDRSSADAEEMRQMTDYETMNGIRERIDLAVKNPEVAESLKPYYNMSCKRPLFHDGYYETYNRDNVTLVDTNGQGVERITEKGLVVDGKEYEVDCIIYASGFEVAVSSDRAGNFDLAGKKGITQQQKHEGGMHSLHGMFFRDFPNYGVIGGLKHASVTVNITYMLAKQSEHFAAVVKHCIDRGASSFDVTQEAEGNWTQLIKDKTIINDKFVTECTPGYYNSEGKNDGTSIWANIYGDGPFAYIGVLEQWRDDSAFDKDMELKFSKRDDA